MKNSEYSFLKSAYARVYQFIFKYASYLLSWKEPKVLYGSDTIFSLISILHEKGKKCALIVTDENICNLGLIDGLINSLNHEDFSYVLYNKTVPNPTINNIDEAYHLYKSKNCDSIIAIGGGSSIDAAKGVGIRVAWPKRSLVKMSGVLKVLKKIPFLVAIPTTAGTGSEATIATVISDEKTKGKYPISDPCLMPKVAILDASLTLKLPKDITATTALDTLTHAVEAYVGNSNTKNTKKYALNAIKLVDTYLPLVYKDGENIEAREKMLQAAMYGGLAFTRAYIGYTHALAHALGGMYGVAHGLANAILLPHVLEAYGESVYNKLADIADKINLTKGQDPKAKSEAFINYIFELNKEMNIPNKIKEIKESDIKELVARALKEAYPLYPVPKLLNEDTLSNILRKVMG
ncbi:MAG: iron-containing alcohol dehydrogenase [Anaerorhabdus sp.]